MRYEDVLADLTDKVKNSAPNTKLPTERTLMATYEVSRSQIRRALDNLESRLLIRKEKGIGAFVAERVTFRVTSEMGPSLHASAEAAGFDMRTDLVESSNVAVPPKVAKLVGPSCPEECLRLVRVGSVDGTLTTHSEEWILPERTRDLYAALGIIESVYDSLKSFGFEPYRYRSTASVEDIPAHALSAWRLSDPTLGWRVVTTTADKKSQDILMVSETWMRMDNIRFEIDFSS